MSCSEDDSSFLEMASKPEQARNHESPKLSRKDQSSAWVSTDEDANGDAFVDECARHGSFSQMVPAGPKANVTGTPQGTGAREVGSSLANASSPNGELSSSPYQALSPVAPVAVFGTIPLAGIYTGLVGSGMTMLDNTTAFINIP